MKRKHAKLHKRIYACGLTDELMSRACAAAEEFGLPVSKILALCVRAALGRVVATLRAVNKPWAT